MYREHLLEGPQPDTVQDQSGAERMAQYISRTPLNSLFCVQDRMVVALDTATGSLLLAVFDGHGQNGHKVLTRPFLCFVCPALPLTSLCCAQVSDHFLVNYPPRLFSDRRFASAPIEAMADVLTSVEDQLIRGTVLL